MAALKLACLWLNSSKGHMGKSYKDMMEPPPKYVVAQWAANKGEYMPEYYNEEPSQVLALFDLLD